MEFRFAEGASGGGGGASGITSAGANSTSVSSAAATEGGKEASETDASTNEASDSPRPPLRLLFVDDSDTACITARAVFESMRFVVDVKHGGMEALNYVCDDDLEPSNIVVLDLDMPHVNGRSLLRVIKENLRWRDVPVVAITATNPNSRVQSELLQIGAFAIAHKPISSEGSVGQTVVRAVEATAATAATAAREKEEKEEREGMPCLTVDEWLRTPEGVGHVANCERQERLRVQERLREAQMRRLQEQQQQQQQQQIQHQQQMQMLSRESQDYIELLNSRDPGDGDGSIPSEERVIEHRMLREQQRAQLRASSPEQRVSMQPQQGQGQAQAQPQPHVVGGERGHQSGGEQDRMLREQQRAQLRASSPEQRISMQPQQAQAQEQEQGQAAASPADVQANLLLDMQRRLLAQDNRIAAQSRVIRSLQQSNKVRVRIRVRVSPV